MLQLQAKQLYSSRQLTEVHMKKTLLLIACLLLMLLSVSPAQAYVPVNNTNWYEVFVYSFKDSDGDGIGDLKGLQSKLDYIEDLGFNGLWLMPLMPSPSYHKYDVVDYYDIDPQYGSLQDMRELVAAANAKNIKIIIDLPVNHSSSRHPWFLEAVEALKKGRTDHPKVGWYVFSQEEQTNFSRVFGTDWYYEEQFQGGGMPDLNLDNPEVRDEIKNILAFWLCDVGVDGFRLDAVTSFYAKDDEKNIAFLRFLQETATSLKTSAFIVGEAWTGLNQLARYYQSGVDSFFLFPASQAEGFVASSMRARRPAQAFVTNLQKVYEAIPQPFLTLAPFLSNHDTGRTVGLVQGRQAIERVKFAHALNNLIGGLAFTYYGEEIGMAGSGADPNKRLGMDWGAEGKTNNPPGVTQEEYPFAPVDVQLEDSKSILTYIKKVNRLRLLVPAIALGLTEFVDVQDNTLIMTRALEGETYFIAINFSAREEASLAVNGLYDYVFSFDATDGMSAVETHRDHIVFRLQPYGIAVVKAKQGGE